MEAKDTVLEGCEIVCIGEQATDLIACPLPKWWSVMCKQHHQYQAGINEVVECIRNNSRPYSQGLYMFAKGVSKLKEWEL